MTTFAQRAVVVDRLVAEWGLEPGDVIAVHVYATDVVLYLRAPVGGIEWTATPRNDGVTYRHKLIREDVEITVISWIEQPAAVSA